MTTLLKDAEYTEEDVDDVVAKAKLAGFIVYRSNPKLLLIDLDNPASVAQYERVLPVIASMYNAVEDDRWVSKGGNQHRLVKLAKPAGVGTRLGLQAMLGSDGLREALALKRVQNGVSEPSLLFRPTTSVSTH